MSEHAPHPAPAPAPDETRLVQYLLAHPDFFERHADLLARVQLASPNGGRTISLQERQAEALREKIALLERRLMEMVRYGNENMLIADKLQRWARQLFLAHRPIDLFVVMVSKLQAQFGVPQVALKAWEVASVYAGEPFAQGVSDDVKSLAASLAAPYCGVNTGFDAVQWLPAPQEAASLALLPLRKPGASQGAFGLLILASPDSHRYEADMATDFLERISEIANAALSQLRMPVPQCSLTPAYLSGRTSGVLVVTLVASPGS